MFSILDIHSLSLVAEIVTSSRRHRSAAFVGVDHPSGEMRLTLAPAGEFRLTLALFDPVVGSVVEQKELAGRWRRAHGVLELRSPTRELDYRPATRGHPGWVWKRSNLPTFADGIALTPDRRSADI